MLNEHIGAFITPTYELILPHDTETCHDIKFHYVLLQFSVTQTAKMFLAVLDKK